MHLLNRATTLICACLITITGAGCTTPVDNADPRIELLDDVMTSFAEHRHFHGVVAAAEGGNVVYEKAFGYGNLEWMAKNTRETRFRIASVTKLFTAVLVMQQVEQGTLRLEGAVTDYLPTYHCKTGDRITIHHLLTHTSGLIDFPDVPEDFDICERLHHDHTQLMTYFEGKALVCEPGERFHYSNFGYVLLAMILEEVTGQTNRQLMQEQILTPAGMKHTGIDDNRTVLNQRASGYHHQFLGEPENSPPLDMSVVLGAGDLYSTAGDLVRFDQALFGGQLVSPESLELMITPVQSVNMQNYGYGCDIRPMEWGPEGVAVTAVGLAGSINGFRSNYVHILEDNRCIVVLSNFKDTSGNTAEVASPKQITDRVATVLYGREPELPGPSAAVAMARLMLDEGADRAKTALADCRKADPAMLFDSDEFKDLALWFCKQDRPAHALEAMRAYCEGETSPSPLDLLRLAALAQQGGEPEEAEEAAGKAADENQWGDVLFVAVGYEFLNNGFHDCAIYLFTRNLAEFPESANTFDSLGEAYMIAGDIEPAIRNYKRALELNPENTNAAAMIAQLEGR